MGGVSTTSYCAQTVKSGEVYVTLRRSVYGSSSDLLVLEFDVIAYEYDLFETSRPFVQGFLNNRSVTFKL